MLDWLAQLLGLPRGWHGHIEDTASTSTVAALAAARTLRPGGVVYASEQANFSVEKAARLVGLEFRTVRSTTSSGCAPDFPLDDATAVVATVGTTGTTSVDPVPELARRCEEAGVWLHVDAAYAGSAAICPELRWCLDGCRPRRLDRRQPAQVAVHADGLLGAVDAPARGVPRGVRGSSPTTWRRPTRRVDLKDYGPALGRRFRALKLWLVLRWYGAEGLRALIREHVRLAQLFAVVGRGRARLGGRRAASVLDRLLPARRGRQRRDRARARPRPASCSSPTTRLRRRGRDPARDRQRRTTEDDVRLAWEVLRASAR